MIDFDRIKTIAAHALRAYKPGLEARACQIVDGVVFWVLIRGGSIDMSVYIASDAQMQIDAFGDGHVHVSVGEEVL